MEKLFLTTLWAKLLIITVNFGSKAKVFGRVYSAAKSFRGITIADVFCREMKYRGRISLFNHSAKFFFHGKLIPNVLKGKLL